jgi:hypothetical protein
MATDGAAALIGKFHHPGDAELSGVVYIRVQLGPQKPYDKYLLFRREDLVLFSKQGLDYAGVFLHMMVCCTVSHGWLEKEGAGGRGGILSNSHKVRAGDNLAFVTTRPFGQLPRSLSSLRP